MSAPHTDDTAHELDALKELPARNNASLVLTLAVQMLNAFNDNFVKFLLIALANAVASTAWLGKNMELLLVSVFNVPYILFAPVAGFLSDRFSKRNVILWTQVIQLVCLAWLTWSFRLRDPHTSLVFALAGFFVLAIQAMLFSPAKTGILKELVGSRRLGHASGWLQMTMMGGILIGMWAGGRSFDYLWARDGDPWRAAFVPMTVIAALCIGEITAAALMMRTPSHPELHFHRGVLWEHFTQVRVLWRNRPVREGALSIVFFWFTSFAISVIVVTASKELHPDLSSSGMIRLTGDFAIAVGIGIILGSFVASAVCRSGIRLGLVRIGAFGLAAGLFCTGIFSGHAAGIRACLVFSGFAGGIYMVPLYAFIQDRSAPHERARILSSMNLLDCLSGVVAVMLVGVLKWAGLSSGWQFAAFGVPAVVVALLVGRLRRWQKHPLV